MSETANIAEMAEILSKEIFSEFFWKRIGPTNEDWPCEDMETHGTKTHPTDLVFYYDEPYSESRTYVNCDLKSYAKKSIHLNSIKNSLESLARQISCAEKSETWKKRYTHDHLMANVCGLLFIYNHDGEYDKDFSKILSSVRNTKLDLPRGSKIFVLGPEDIFWLDNVRYEIRHLRSHFIKEERLPDLEFCSYYYPQLVRKARLRIEKARSATLEMLTSPWIILEYDRPPPNSKKGIMIFSRRKGESVGEFAYMFDYLRLYQKLEENIEITVKMLDPTDEAKSIFSKAKDQYLDEMTRASKDTDFAERVKNIKYSKINQIVTKFSSVDIGMKDA